MNSIRMVSILLLAVLSTALAAGHQSQIAFLGNARPVVPVSTCANILPTVKRVGGLYQYSGDLRLASSLKLSSCWRGQLRGQPFTLTGYTDRDNDSAVTVQYGHRSALFAISNGLPIVTQFTGDVVCYIPNPAKGVAYAIDIRTLALRGDVSSRCAQSDGRPDDEVKGLSGHYKIGFGVLPPSR